MKTLIDYETTKELEKVDMNYNFLYRYLEHEFLKPNQSILVKSEKGLVRKYFWLDSPRGPRLAYIKWPKGWTI